MNAYEQIARAADSLYDCEPRWETFYREILGVNGVVRHALPDAKERDNFYKHPLYRNIIARMNELQKRKHNDACEDEPTRVITVRLPKSLHISLIAEAHRHRTSLNKLCISKLIHPQEIAQPEPPETIPISTPVEPRKDATAISASVS